MQYNSEDIMSLLAAWRRVGKIVTFVAHEHGAYVHDERGETLQFLTPESLRN